MAKSKKGIELSPKHGLNPTMDVCFWCGKSKGVAILGRIRGEEKKGDVKAPREMIFGLEPCDECKQRFALGVQVIEVTDDGGEFNSNARFAFKGNDGRAHYPTGRYVVVKPEAIKDGKAGSKVLCDKATMDRLLSMANKEESNANA